MVGTRMVTLGCVAEAPSPFRARSAELPSMLRTSTCTSTTGVVMLPVLHVLVVRRHLSGHASAIDPGALQGYLLFVSKACLIQTPCAWEGADQ